MGLDALNIVLLSGIRAAHVVRPDSIDERLAATCSWYCYPAFGGSGLGEFSGYG